MANGTKLGGLAGKAEGVLSRRKKQIDEMEEEATKLMPEEPEMNPAPRRNGNGNGSVMRKRNNWPWD